MANSASGRKAWSRNCSRKRKSPGTRLPANHPFLPCSGYPDCNYSRDYIRDEKGRIQPVEAATEEVTDKTCEKCGRPMVIKRGRYGEFMACSGYPDCKQTLSLNPNGSGKSTGVKCPVKGCDGELIEKTSRRGKIFYGCNRFPTCDFATWDKPVNKVCPGCGTGRPRTARPTARGRAHRESGGPRSAARTRSCPSRGTFLR